MERLDAGFFHHFVGAIGVESLDVHAETFGNAGNVAAYLAEGLDAEMLALELKARSACIHIAGGHHAHAEHKFRNGVGVLAGSIFGNNPIFGRGLEVDVVITSACTDHNFKVLGSIEHFGIDFVRADDQTVGIGDSGQ